MQIANKLDELSKKQDNVAKTPKSTLNQQKEIKKEFKQIEKELKDLEKDNKALKEPMVGATLLGTLFLWQGWRTPDFLTNTLDLIGQMAIPLMLITLGVAVARLKPKRIVQAFILSFAKYVICAAVALGIGLSLGLSDVPLAVLILQTATPVAVTAYLLAEKYGGDAEAVAGLVVVSTLMSVAAIPLLLTFLL